METSSKNQARFIRKPAILEKEALCLAKVQSLIIIQMNQKKKNTVLPLKKLKSVKSEQTLPFGTLMLEIGQLREELKTIKLSKKQDQQSQSPPQDRIKSNKENKDRIIIELKDIECISREFKLRTDLQANKLRRALSSNQEDKIARVINELIELFNTQIGEITRQRNIYKQELKELQATFESERKQEEEKYRVISRNNKKLQKELEELKQHLFALIKQKDGKDQVKKDDNQKQAHLINDLRFQVEVLTKENQELVSIAQEWELQCHSMEERCHNYEKNVEMKSQEILLIQEDIKYLRFESQKFKNQKREIEKLWEKAIMENKETKRSLGQEVQKLEREKNKWMNECSLRRHESQQIQAIESHRELLFKEIQDLRNSYALKCKELAEAKSQLHEAQRKMITLESQTFKAAQQKDKAQREIKYWEQEIEKLRGEVTDCQSYKQKKTVERKRKQSAIKINQEEKKVRDEKLKALDDIHSLIRQHKQKIQGDQ